MGTTQQGVPQGIELLTQRKRIDLLDPLAQFSLPILRENSRGQQTLQRRLGDIIHPAHPVALVNIRLELERGLKAIDDEPQRSVDLAQLLIRLHSHEPLTAHRLAHHGSVLLLYMALIVFDPWAAAREGQLFLFTIARSAPH